MISGSLDQTIKIWNPIDGTSKLTLNVNDHVILLATLPNGDLVSLIGDTDLYDKQRSVPKKTRF